VVLGALAAGGGGLLVVTAGICCLGITIERGTTGLASAPATTPVALAPAAPDALGWVAAGSAEHAPNAKRTHAFQNNPRITHRLMDGMRISDFSFTAQ
jgi:hypothetical protein